MTTTPAFTVETVERRTKTGLMASLVFNRPATPDTEGWYARIVFDNGAAFDLSQLDGEDGWTVDGVYGPTGLPGFVNGYGARYLATKQLADDAAAVVDRHPRSVAV
jgi:hypothetical protein